ncbi:MAG: HD domain-containing protein [Patescibacteria group bacterium]
MEGAELIEKAKAYAHRAHTGHKRMDAEGSPYIVHPEEVADLVAKSGGSAQEVAAAWLHDTVEDTPTTIEDIKREFGDEIAEIVHGLTDLPEFEKLPVAERKAKQAERVRGESISVRRIKLADQTSNVPTVGSGMFLDMTPGRALDYVRGAKSIAEECKGISPFLDTLFEERYQAALKNLSNAG